MENNIDIDKEYNNYLEDSPYAPDDLREALVGLEAAFDEYIGKVTEFEWRNGFACAMKAMLGGEI